MKEHKLIHTIENIDDQYILEALLTMQPKNQKSSRFISFKKYARSVVAAAAVILVGTTAVYAYYSFTNRTEVNQNELPKIGEMHCIESYDFSDITENAEYYDYTEIVNKTGLNLLSSSLSEANPYMQVTIKTDKKDYAIINVENYILGDTSNYQLVEDVNSYNCTPGEKYHSSIALEVDLILSQKQLENGFDYEYLGEYEYLASYISEKGYHVNLVQDTTDTISDEFISKKFAFFVADGVRYTLSGRVSVEEMKRIVDSMNY